MSKTFTDDDGNKYELTKLGTGLNDWGLKPLQPAETELEKRAVNVHIHVQESSDMVHGRTLFTGILTQPQATALADAIKALVEYCQTPRGDKIGVYSDHSIAQGKAYDAMSNAWSALQGDQS